jgi:hypothetical protein
MNLIVDQIKEIPMTLQIGDVFPDFRVDTTEAALGIQPHKGNRPKDLEVMASATACSPMVFTGLVAWASLNGHIPLAQHVTGEKNRPANRQGESV